MMSASSGAQLGSEIDGRYGLRRVQPPQDPKRGLPRNIVREPAARKQGMQDHAEPVDVVRRADPSARERFG